MTGSTLASIIPKVFGQSWISRDRLDVAEVWLGLPGLGKAGKGLLI